MAAKGAEAVEKHAVISKCGKYRYVLDRYWDVKKPTACFVMLNPSTADATKDDPTIRRCMAFATAWGCGGIRVVNLFAFRATDPKALLTADDPIGPDNDHYITGAVVCCEPVVAAWGAGVPAQYMYRPGHVRKLAERLRVTLTCLAKTASGDPRHPLYLRAALTPVPLFPRRRTRP